jgi:hypothetical protein
MVKDKFGNYVVQKMIEFADQKIKENIIKRIETSNSKRDGFSKHVLNFIEKNKSTYGGGNVVSGNQGLGQGQGQGYHNNYNQHQNQNQQYQGQNQHFNQYQQNDYGSHNRYYGK